MDEKITKERLVIYLEYYQEQKLKYDELREKDCDLSSYETAKVSLLTIASLICDSLIKYLDQMIRKIRSGSCVEVPSRLYNVSKLTALVARRVFRAHQGGSVIVNPNQSIPIGATFLETPKKLQPPHLQIAVHKCKSCIPPMHNLWISCSQPGITHPSKSPGQVNLLVC